VIKHDVPCSPCAKKVCNDMRCWESITVEEVFEEVSSLIRRKVQIEPVSYIAHSLRRLIEIGRKEEYSEVSCL
jgi:hypothetical protein